MLEKIIISNLMKNDAYSRRVLPNMKKEYFRSNSPDRVAFELIDGYTKRYNQLPSPEALVIELDKREDLTEQLFKETAGLLGECIEDKSEIQLEWLETETETFCQDKALHNAISKSLEIMRASDKELKKGAIPGLLSEALAVSFNPRVGHDYFEDSEDRFVSFYSKEKKLGFDVDILNRITKGGLDPATLNVIMAQSGAGKSLFMAHMAATHLMMGKNVLYISLELSKEAVGSRIDANLMGIDIGTLDSIPKDILRRKIKELKEKTTGRLIIEQYGAGGARHFRNLLDELKLKKNFVPDVIFIDYLNLCMPTEKLSAGSDNSYSKVKAVAEELRHIAVDWQVPVVTATQTNRAGYGGSSVGMEHVSDSLGIVMTADWLIGLIQTKELADMGQIKVQHIKSRYTDVNRLPYFFLGIDKTTMRIFDLDKNSDLLPESNNSGVVGRSGLDFGGFK